MKIRYCSNCDLKVVPEGDGHCPGCHRRFDGRPSDFEIAKRKRYQDVVLPLGIFWCFVGVQPFLWVLLADSRIGLSEPAELLAFGLSVGFIVVGVLSCMFIQIAPKLGLFMSYVGLLAMFPSFLFAPLYVPVILQAHKAVALKRSL